MFLMINVNDFLSQVKNCYLDKFEALFTVKFSFTGDDEKFNTQAQQLFFRTIFREGNACLLNLKKNQQLAVFRYYPSPDPKRALKAIGLNGRVLSAVVFPAWRNFQGGLTFSNVVQNDLLENPVFRNAYSDNVVFFQSFLGEDYIQQVGLRKRLEVFVEEIAKRHLKANLYNSIAGGKLVTSNSPEIVHQIENNLFEADKVINIKGNYDRINEKWDVKSDVDKNIQHIDIGKLDPTTFLDGITAYEQLVYRLFGFRTNQQFKPKERLITAEVENGEVEFKGLDLAYRRALDMFIQDYKNKLGVELKLIDNMTPTHVDNVDGEGEGEIEDNKESEGT